MTELSSNERMRQLQRCLGGEWPDFGPLRERVERTEQLDGYQRQYVTYQVEPEERIAAWLLMSDGGKSHVLAPGTSFCHQDARQ